MANIDNLRKILSEEAQDIALIIGNGINRHKETGNISSWNSLLHNLWERHSGEKLAKIPEGISLTEFFDLLEVITASANKNGINFQQEFCNPLDSWTYREHHRIIGTFVLEREIPVLTTNFDTLIARAIGLEFFRLKQEPFTQHYPWGCYYSNREIESPTNGFGIWHINGMQKYYQSIRLGLTHYMGSVAKARKLLHQDDEDNLFSGKNTSDWKGRYNWLHIVFNKSLFIFGLKLEENEVFVRWLLIERAKYFKLFPRYKKRGWYITTKKEPNSGKELFLSKLGFEYIVVDSYDDIYERLWV